MHTYMSTKKSFLPKIFILAAIALGLTLTTQTTVSQAAYNPVPRNICTLMIKPFNAALSPTYGTAGDQWINYISSQICGDHIAYDNSTGLGYAYTPQPPVYNDNPLKSGADKYHLPITRHDHTYYNDSLQDDYYYKSFVDKFEITVQSDAFDNTDTSQIKCDTAVPYDYNVQNIDQIKDCDGTLNDLWGGTKVTKSFNNSNKTVTVTWDFATQKTGEGYVNRPYIWGNNGSAFKTYQKDGTIITVNTADEKNRKLPFSIYLTSKDNNQIWSATTTSRVLLADSAVKKTNYPAHATDGCIGNDVNNSSSGWCYLDAPSQYASESIETSGGGFHNYYWFRIGSVVTVWKEAITPPGESTCAALNFTQSPAGVLLEGATATFKINPVDNQGKSLSNEYAEWSITNGTINNTAGPTTISVPANHSVTYKNTTAGNGVLSVKMKAPYANANCTKSINIVKVFIPEQPEEKAVCAALNFTQTPPGAIFEGDQVTFKVNPVDDNGKSLSSETVQWTIKNGTINNTAGPTTLSLPATHTVTFSNGLVGTDVISVKLLGQYASVNCERSINVLKKDVPPPPNICVQLDLTSSGGNPLYQFQSSTLTANPIDNYGQPINDILVWNTTSGYFLDPNNNNAFSQHVESSNKNITYVAGEPQSNAVKVSMKTPKYQNSNCERYLDVIATYNPPPPPPPPQSPNPICLPNGEYGYYGTNGVWVVIFPANVGGNPCNKTVPGVPVVPVPVPPQPPIPVPPPVIPKTGPEMLIYLPLFGLGYTGYTLFRRRK